MPARVLAPTWRSAHRASRGSRRAIRTRPGTAGLILAAAVFTGAWVISASPGAAAAGRGAAASPGDAAFADSMAPGGGAESPPAPLLIPGRTAPPDTAARTPAQRASEHFLLGLALEREGHPGAAIAAYNNAVRADPTVSEAWYRSGRLYLARGRVDEAVRCFRAELRYHPEHVEAARELGLGLAQLGDTTHAIAELKRLTRVRPRDDESWRALGIAYSAAGRTRQAEAALLRAVKLPPRRAVEHRDLGALMASLGRETEARAEYRRAIALDPKEATAWYNLANLERRAGRPEQALAAYREASARDTGFSLAVQGQVQVLIELKREREAGEMYRRWLRARADDHNARLEAVRLFDDLGRQDIAVEIARDGVRRSPRSSDAHTILGMALYSRGDMPAAAGEMRKAEELARTATDRGRIRQLLATMRASAADSLRAQFAPDSAASDSAR